MYKSGGQGRIQGDLGGLWLCPWHSHLGCCQWDHCRCDREQRESLLLLQGAAHARDHTHWGIPILFPVPSAPCWPLPTPPTPSSLAASAGGCMLCWAPVSRYKAPLRLHPARDTSHQHSTSKPSVTHQTSGLHSIACINPVPIFASKAALSKAIQMPEIRDYYDFMSCWKTGGGEHNVCVGFKCLLKSFLSFLIDVASVFRLGLLREKRKKTWRSYSEK